MKKIHLIFLSLFLFWGCGGGGGDGDSPQAPIVSGGTLSITWNMSQSATVEENSNGATLIDATLNNSTVKLAFSLSGSDSSKFNISSGYLVFVNTPDYESPSDLNTDNSYSLTISAAAAGVSSTHAFTVNVTDVNEKPTFTTANSSAFSSVENSTSLKTIEATDPENDSLTFSLEESSGSQDEGLLLIDSASGTVSFKVAPNFEIPTDLGLNNSLTFTVVASDGSLSSSKEFYANITNVAEAPTNIAVSNNSVSENIVGALFGVLNITDEDLDIKSIAITDSDSGCFRLDTDLNLSLCPSYGTDYERKNSYTIEITLEDNGGFTFTDTLTLTITDINEAPTNITLSGGSAAENSAGASFGTLSTTDPDAVDTFSYAVTGGADAASFEIGTSDTLKFKSTVSGNFETKSTYSVVVTSTDSGSESVSSTLSISLTDVNESPTDIALSGGSAAENSAGASFGTLSTTDPDASDSFSYSVTGGTDAASFEIGTSDTLKFKSTVAGNFESKSSYSVTVTSTDAGSNTYAETLTVSITNVNEAASFTTSSTASADENGTAVLTAAASDPESGSLTYSLGTGNDTTKFSITSAGVLTFNRAPDYEIPSDSDENNTYLVNLIVSDGSFSTTLALTVYVMDVNEPAALNVPENIQTVETQE